MEVGILRRADALKRADVRVCIDEGYTVWWAGRP